VNPLAVSVGAVMCTILIHAVVVTAIVDLFRMEKRGGHVGKSLWLDIAIVGRAVALALVAHLIEMAVWAVLFVICGEFADFGTAYYHSAVNYTTLGYGDVLMSASWKLLGPLEAANGMLLFGVTTAMLFAIMQGLVKARYADLRD
jgi:ion channel